MATAREARTWAHTDLRGIGDSLYTPFSGTDGDDIDWDAYRTLVRYCVGDLGHPMLWVTSGVGEFWSLTIDERKRLLGDRNRRGAGYQSRRRHPVVHRGAFGKGLPRADAARPGVGCRHRLHPDADDGGCTPAKASCGSSATSADRTDIALGMFNSPSSGYVLTAAESARIVEEIPAVCATKEGAFRPANSRQLHELAPELVIWECDTTVYRAGWLRAGHRRAGATGHGGISLRDTAAADPHRVLGPDLERQAGRGDGLRGRVGARPVEPSSSRLGPPAIPGRPDYFTHWGGAFKYAASVLGLPVGDHPRFPAPAGAAARGCARADPRRVPPPGADRGLRSPGPLRKTLPIGVQYVHTCSSEPQLRRPPGECR